MSHTANLIPVQLKLLDSRLASCVPTPATPGAAAVDLYAAITASLTLGPGEQQLITTGMSLYIGNPSYAAFILPRSGLGSKNGIVLGNLVGLIDSDYQGPLMVCVWNRSDKPFVIEPMTRIAQMCIMPVVLPDWQIVQEFTTTSDRGAGGFGSTGTKHNA